MTDCCTNHDGPHVHDCQIGRRTDGTEHRGGCLLAQEKTATAWQGDDRQQEPQHPSEATGEPTMKTTEAIVPPATDNTECPGWCDRGRGHRFDLGYTLHRGIGYLSVPIVDSDDRFDITIEQLDDDPALIEVSIGDGCQYLLTRLGAQNLARALRHAAELIA